MAGYYSATQQHKRRRSTGRLSHRRLQPSSHDAVSVRLSLEPLCGNHDDDDDDEQRRHHGLDVHVPPGSAVPVFAALSARKLEPGQYQLVHLVEYSGKKLLGGVSYVVIHPHEEATS